MGAHCEGRAAKPRGTRVEANLSSFLPLICIDSFYCSLHVALRKEGQFGNRLNNKVPTPLSCTINLQNFILSLIARGSEERRTIW